MKWEYERGDQDGRLKHRWNKDEAGFEPGQKGAIGKCPKHTTKAIAQQALNNGVPLFDTDNDENADSFPSKIYTTYKGVIYEAAVTTPGKSFHAYPWRALPGRPPLPNSILQKLEEKLETDEEKRIFKRWLKIYGR